MVTTLFSESTPESPADSMNDAAQLEAGQVTEGGNGV